jgi:branched-chain amino acid transport system permease protein
MIPSIYLQVLINGILLGGLYILLAIGLNIVTGVLKIINFAHGDLVMLGMYVAFWLSVFFGLNPLLILPSSFIVLGVIGLLSYVGVFSFVLRAGDFEHLLSTIGLGLLLQGLAQLLWKSDYRLLKFELPPLLIWNIYISPVMLSVFTISLFASIILYIFLLKTRIGIFIRAVAQDSEMASLVGINKRKIHLITTMIGFGFAGLAGGLLMLMFPAYPTAGFVYGLLAWVIMVIGGLGSILGAFIGGLIIGIIEVSFATFYNIELARAVAFILFITIIALKPSGLLGERARV